MQIAEELFIAFLATLANHVFRRRQPASCQLVPDLTPRPKRQIPPIRSLHLPGAQPLILNHGQHDDLRLAVALDDDGHAIIDGATH
jgi:hypothetical protein